jgi:hypothetical protein
MLAADTRNLVRVQKKEEHQDVQGSNRHAHIPPNVRWIHASCSGNRTTAEDGRAILMCDMGERGGGRQGFRRGKDNSEKKKEKRKKEKECATVNTGTETAAPKPINQDHDRVKPSLYVYSIRTM